MARRRSRYGYEPALDGFRGVSMVLFMAYHLGLTQMPGMWIGMNYFFVLSGYLIARLLIEEHLDTGGIDLLAFYRRRIRRLIPALLLVLAAVIVWGLTFADAGARSRLRGDVLATLFYVMNWRLILQGDRYFEEFGSPSILRHAWTLSMEEQFYAVAPFLVLIIVALLASRRAQALAVFGLALLLAVWSTRVDLNTLTGQAHAYYGTDIRAQSILVGVALAFWLAPTSDRRKYGRWPAATVSHALGWAGLAGLLAIYASVPPLAPWMFSTAGLLWSSLLCAAIVLGCSQPGGNLLQRVLGVRPAAYVGRLSYSLYLWHWPVRIWLDQAWPNRQLVASLVVGMAITFALAVASYELLERRITRRGLQGISRNRGVARGTAVVAVLAVFAGAFAVSGPASAGAGAARAPDAGPTYVASIPALVPGQPAYVRPTPDLRLGVYGDSVGNLLVANYPSANFPGLLPTSLAVDGCDLLDEPVEWTSTQLQANDGPCTAMKRDWPGTARTDRLTTLVIVASVYLALPHRVDGKRLWWNDPAYPQLIGRKLDSLVAQAKAAGIRSVQIANVPCRQITDLAVPEQYREAARRQPEVVNEAQNPRQVNAFLSSWGAAHGVPVIDLYGALCSNGYRRTHAGITVFNDSLHFSPAATPMIWGWLGPQIIAGARRAGVVR